MRRAHVHPFAGRAVGPAARHAAAWKHQSVRAVTIDDSQLKVAAEGCIRDRLPHGANLRPFVRPHIDLDQAAPNNRTELIWIKRAKQYSP